MPNDFEKEADRTAKELILLAKGYYDKGKYPDVLDALKEYYRKYYNDDEEERLDKSFLLENLVWPHMEHILRKYPDRNKSFLTALRKQPCQAQLLATGETGYEPQLFDRCIVFLSGLRMRGDGWMEIDVSPYLRNKDGINVLKKPII